MYKMNPAELDSIDNELLLLVAKGNTAPYSVWTAMKSSGEKPMAYINVNKRMTRLFRLGFLEEIKIDLVNLHGRKDYKLSMKGLEQLIPYLLEYPKEIETIIKYIDKFGLDKNLFGLSLLEKHTSMTKLLNTYEDNTSILFNDSYWARLSAAKSKLSGKIQQTLNNFNSETEILIEHIYESSDAQRAYNKELDEYQQRVINEDKLKSMEELYEELIGIISTVSKVSDSVDMYKQINTYFPKRFPRTSLKLDVKRLHKKILEQKAKTGETQLNNEVAKMIMEELRSEESQEELKEQEMTDNELFKKRVNELGGTKSFQELIKYSSGQNVEIEKYIKELLSKEYVSYDPKTKRYSITKKGKKNIESTRLQLLEIFFNARAIHTKEVDEQISMISKELESKPRSYNKIDKMLIEITSGEKKKPI